MNRDELVFAALVLVFALFVTVHVALCLPLATRTPRVRAFIAFVLPPLAPYWAVKDGHHKRVALWVLFAVAYGVMLVVASR